MTLALVCAALAAANAVDAQRAPPPSAFAPVQAGEPFAFARHAKHPATPAVRAHLLELLRPHTASSDVALAGLRAQGAGAVEVLADEYRDTPADRHQERWLLVHAIGEARHPASVQFFSTLLAQPVPAGDGDHHYGPDARDRVIKLAAVRGLEALARDGHRPALALLGHLVTSSPHPSIVREAFVAYAGVQGDEVKARAELQPQMPAARRAWLEVTRRAPPERGGP